MPALCYHHGILFLRNTFDDSYIKHVTFKLTVITLNIVYLVTEKLINHGKPLKTTMQKKFRKLSLYKKASYIHDGIEIECTMYRYVFIASAIILNKLCVVKNRIIRLTVAKDQAMTRSFDSPRINLLTQTPIDTFYQ